MKDRVPTILLVHEAGQTLLVKSRTSWKKSLVIFAAALAVLCTCSNCHYKKKIVEVESGRTHTHSFPQRELLQYYGQGRNYGNHREIYWATPQYILTADSFEYTESGEPPQSMANALTFDIGGDPGDDTYHTIEIHWQDEFDLERRFYAYFYSDGTTTWFTNEARTYNKTSEWIEFVDPAFYLSGNVGECLHKDYLYLPKEQGSYEAIIFKNLNLVPFLGSWDNPLDALECVDGARLLLDDSLLNEFYSFVLQTQFIEKEQIYRIESQGMLLLGLTSKQKEVAYCWVQENSGTPEADSSYSFTTEECEGILNRAPSSAKKIHIAEYTDGSDDGSDGYYAGGGIDYGDHTGIYWATPQYILTADSFEYQEQGEDPVRMANSSSFGIDGDTGDFEYHSIEIYWQDDKGIRRRFNAYFHSDGVKTWYTDEARTYDKTSEWMFFLEPAFYLSGNVGECFHQDFLQISNTNGDSMTFRNLNFVPFLKSWTAPYDALDCVDGAFLVFGSQVEDELERYVSDFKDYVKDKRLFKKEQMYRVEGQGLLLLGLTSVQKEVAFCWIQEETPSGTYIGDATYSFTTEQCKQKLNSANAKSLLPLQLQLAVSLLILLWMR